MNFEVVQNTSQNVVLGPTLFLNFNKLAYYSLGNNLYRAYGTGCIFVNEIFLKVKLNLFKPNLILYAKMQYHR